MAKYKCKIAGCDFLEITKQNEGINFSIDMYFNNIDGFNSPSVVLTETEVIKIINQLQNLIKK